MDLGMPEQISPAQVLRVRYRNRLPARLDDLVGPIERGALPELAGGVPPPSDPPSDVS